MSATAELVGGASKSRFNNRTPAIYVRKAAEDEEAEEEQSQSSPDAKLIQSHYVLLRLQVDDDRRVVYTFTAWQAGIKQGRHVDEVESATVEVENGAWVKITPKQPLEDGEYAVVRLPDDKKSYEPYVYDFGIGPPAPPIPRK